MIQIKEPCNADWQEMTPANSGKYCGSCEKVVVDFSKMTDVEIKNYFITYSNQKTCGRFLDSQLERPLILPPVTRFNKLLIQLNQIPVTRTILLFLTSVSIWISGCVKNNNDGQTTGDTTYINENNNSRLTDDTATAIEQHDNLLIKQNPDGIKMGEIAPVKMLPPDFLMGDVDVCQPTDEPDTVAVTIPATGPDTTDVTIHMIKGKVMLRDTITQEIKRRKK